MPAVADLRERPDFFETVANRVWRAFWKEGGHPLATVAALARESLGPGPVPTTLVAHEGGVFLGTVSVIACDEASRPHYSPWIAALWVEPDHRRRGIGDLLLARAREIAARAGAARIYLAASEERRPYYEKRGWIRHERDVPRAGMHVFVTTLRGHLSKERTLRNRLAGSGAAMSIEEAQ